MAWVIGILVVWIVLALVAGILVGKTIKWADQKESKL